MNHVSRISWADLPAVFIIFGLLHDIHNHNFLDLYQCLAVCRSWRFVAKQIWRNHVLPTTPWLLHKETRHKLVFNTNLYKWHKRISLDTNDNDSSFSFSLDLHPMETHASCNGWLLTATSDYLPFLYNPVTALLLPLPLLSEDLVLHSHMKFVLSSTTPTDINCTICLKFSSKREFMNDTTTLAFCRPASSSSWLTLHESVEDIIFCGGKFYAIDDSGALFVYNDDIINSNTAAYTTLSWWKMKIAGEISGINSRSSLDLHRFFFYLVESKIGELLLIKRIFEPNHCTCTTESFCVFKLKYWSDTKYGRYNYYYWDEIHCLHENESLLLGWNDCISVSVNDDHNTYKSNCLYFYDETIGSHLTAYGMYDLENCIILKKAEDLDMMCHCKFFTLS